MRLSSSEPRSVGSLPCVTRNGKNTAADSRLPAGQAPGSVLHPGDPPAHPTGARPGPGPPPEAASRAQPLPTKWRGFACDQCVRTPAPPPAPHAWVNPLRRLHLSSPAPRWARWCLRPHGIGAGRGGHVSASETPAIPGLRAQATRAPGSPQPFITQVVCGHPGGFGVHTAGADTMHTCKFSSLSLDGSLSPAFVRLRTALVGSQPVAPPRRPC